MTSSCGLENIYSPETLAFGIRELKEQTVRTKQEIAAKQVDIDRQKREAEEAIALVLSEADKNRLERSRIAQENATLENKEAMLNRGQASHDSRERATELPEDQRRRNRTMSLAFIEDSFAYLSPESVVKNITNTSSAIKKHAMDNISACITGFQGSESSSNYVRFTPQDIAPDLPLKLHELVATLNEPSDHDLQFAQMVISAPPIAKALALSGQCLILSDFLIEKNELVSSLAVCSFRRMIKMEMSVSKPAYEALSRVIPLIQVSEFNKPTHPSITFVKKVTPKIIEDYFNEGLWSAVAPLARHSITSIRQIALHEILILTQHSDRNQHGIVEAGILNLLDQYYLSPSPPSDITEFFVNILPFITESLCRRSSGIQWLVMRLSDPSPSISEAVIAAFRKCVEKQNPIILEMFVKEGLLKKLDKPYTRPSPAITNLICQLLPVLAIPYARVEAAEGIISLLVHPDASIVNACLLACFKIVDSTIEQRIHLFTVISKFPFDFKIIVQFIQHPELRLRHPALKIWCYIICSSPCARSKIVQDGLLDVIFDLCFSQYADAVNIGAKCCVSMAPEIIKAGANSTRQLVNLLNHPSSLLRQAALRAIQFASGSDHASCKALLEADAFKALQLFFQSYPKDLIDNAHCKILARLAPFVYGSPEACTGLLQLLESSSPFVERAAQSALTIISVGNFEGRQTLRTVVLSHLGLPLPTEALIDYSTEALIEYSTKAIQDWIGPDLAQLKDFTTFFRLIFHSDRRIQTTALMSLKEQLSNSDHQESLEKADVTVMIRKLADIDNPEALNFVIEALRVLALSFSRNGHSSIIIDLLMHGEPKVQEGAAAALEAIANGSAQERKSLVKDDIIGRLIGHDEHLGQMQLRLLSSIIPKLAIDYLDIGKIERILQLLDHQQQPIRTAATQCLAIIPGEYPEQKTRARDLHSPPLYHNTFPLLREASARFSETLARDLVVNGDFAQLFRILQSKNVHKREPIIKGLQNYIQGSDEAARRHLVDAGILPAILRAYTSTKADLLNFMSTCVLPILGPSFTQKNGGSTLFPLLTHEEPRIRAATIQALQNAMDSPHGNVKNMAKAGVIRILYPVTITDDAVRELWCHILPKVVPFLENRVEINILFDSLRDIHRNMRKAASNALNIMAKTSEVTRGHIFPALLQNLENPSPSALPLIAQAISLSGFTFVSSGKELDLILLILHDRPDVAVAAIKATTEVLTKGSSSEHQKLLQANVFPVALNLHKQQPRLEHLLNLLYAIIKHLSYKLLTDPDLARKMFFLFDDPDPDLHRVLSHTWSNDPRVIESNVLPNFLPLLFDNDRLGNPFVINLLCKVAPKIVPQLVSQRKFDIIVKTLTLAHIDVIQLFLQKICAVIEKSDENEKELFVSQSSFVAIIGWHLAESRDADMHNDCSTIVQLLSKDSPSRSGKIINADIGHYLSWVVVNGKKEARNSSLDALHSLYTAAPDHAGRLVIVTNFLPSLANILQSPGAHLDLLVKIFRLLLAIVQQSPHSSLIRDENGIIVVRLVHWMSVENVECKEVVFDICRLIAEKSDAGRQALIYAEVLPELSRLATSKVAFEVCSACKILKALACTGNFSEAIISAGLMDTMERISKYSFVNFLVDNTIRPFRKPTSEDKQLAQAQSLAKDILETLKLSKICRTVHC